MALLTNDLQDKLKDTLVEDGLISAAELHEFEKKAASEGVPLLSLLLKSGSIDDESLTRAIAHVSGTQYVNLQEV
ncbi:MAG TPA: type II/IV secretion system protein, partial [Candidatus Saccharimonadales bacterium]